MVEPAQAVESAQGPDVADAMIAQVGTNVGARMEESYRAARRLTGRLAPEQLADLYVRLKAALDGDFHVIEADQRRIVLGNRRCPFGAVVRREPRLCRMTSSVFGGIAARNRDGAAVVLEERIALGDPECRVVVWLDGSASPRPYGAHFYMPSAPPEQPDPDSCRRAGRPARRGVPVPAGRVAFMREPLRAGSTSPGRGTC